MDSIWALGGGEQVETLALENGFSLIIATGKDIRHFLESIARFRVVYFKEYPYLYAGNVDYEKKYLGPYTEHPHNFALIIKNAAGKVSGISTAITLSPEAELTSLLKHHLTHLDPKESLYFAETILKPDCREQGLYRKICETREGRARFLGYKKVCFLTVERDPHDPKKPAGYQSPYEMFSHLGYQKTDQLIPFHWPTVLDSTKDASHMMRFWEKKL